MSIRFEPCPVHEPTGVEYEKPCVFNDETGRWACAVCGAEGEFKPEMKLTSLQKRVGPEVVVTREQLIAMGYTVEGETPARIGKFKQLVDPENGKKVMSAAVFAAGVEKLAEVLESAKANGDVTVTVKCFESEGK